MGHRIHVKRDRYKFSCAHMTVFPDGRKERLHGHNYSISVTLELRDIRFEAMIDFALVKRALAELCARWREHTVIAARNPFHETVRLDDQEIEFRLCGRRYVLPREDALILPIDNASVEQLADHATDLLLEALGEAVDPAVVESFSVTVEENPGQGATAVRRFEPDLSAH